MVVFRGSQSEPSFFKNTEPLEEAAETVSLAQPDCLVLVEIRALIPDSCLKLWSLIYLISHS